MEDIHQQFSRVYDESIERIYRFVYLKVSSQEIAEDLSSDVFMRAWREFQKKDKEIENPLAFVYQIARHVIADYYRANKISIVSVEVDVEEELFDSIEEYAFQSIEVDQIRIAISSLHDDYQNYIIWYYLEELTVPEIVQLCGKPEGSVRVGIHRALQSLRKTLELEASDVSLRSGERGNLSQVSN